MLIVGEKHLSTFFGDTKDLTPEERGKHLETDAVRNLLLISAVCTVVRLVHVLWCMLVNLSVVKKKKFYILPREGWHGVATGWASG